MYLNDLNSAQHSVNKLNKILADTFNHEVDLSSMNYESLNKMLSTTNAKIEAIKESDLKYWENAQYNKLGLIQHQLKTYITELAPARVDGKKMKKESTVMEADLDQAEVLLAAQELVDEMQKMVEDVAEMQVQKLMPIVDAMKQQVGFEVAEAYNASADAALGGLLDQMKSAKEALENATMTARGEQPATPAPTDMGMDMDAEAPMDPALDADPEDDFGGDEANAGEENPVGRELKGESAIANMEKGALAEKKFLESKDRLFKMVESGQMSQEHFINVINELDFKDFISKANMDRISKGLSGGNKPAIGKVGKDAASTGAELPRQFEPLQAPNLQNKRGFTPGEQEPEQRLQNKRGFKPSDGPTTRGDHNPALKHFHGKNMGIAIPGIHDPKPLVPGKPSTKAPSPNTPGQPGTKPDISPRYMMAPTPSPNRRRPMGFADVAKQKSRQLGKSWKSV